MLVYPLSSYEWNNINVSVKDIVTHAADIMTYKER